MPTNTFDLAVGLAVGLLVAWVYVLTWKVRYTAAIREDAVQRSQAITAGKIYEQVVPCLPGFPYNPKDIRFLGSPVDFVVFDGLAKGQVERILFLEVKTGGAGLTNRERSVRNAVQAREVEWLEVRVTRAASSGAA